MSQKGLNKAVEVLTLMQLAKLKLIEMGCKKAKMDTQDVLLGKMFEKAENSIKDDFCKITKMETL